MLFACETSKQMLKKLEAISGHKSEASLHVLEQKFYIATNDKDGRIGAYITKLSQMKALGKTVSEGMLIGKVINTLPTTFAHYHSAWNRTSESEKNLNNLAARLVTEEKKLKNKQPELKK